MLTDRNLFSPKNIISLLLLSLLFSSCGNHIMKKRPQKIINNINEQHSSYDVAIVPGYPFDGASWDKLVKARLLWALTLYKNGIVRNFIMSGGAVHSPYVEAAVMRKYAIALGIPAENIFVETKAQHSTENIFYSYELARQLGFKSIALCTDPLQSYFTKSFTRKRFKTKIQHLPFVIDSIRNLENLDPEIDTSNMKVEDFKPLNQKKNRWQQFRGTMGAGIPWNGEKVRPKL